MSKVLIVEDEAHIRGELVDWLTFEGYETLQAANGRVGLALARQARPDLIVCDISMPEMDGFEMLMEVRSDPSICDTPFVFLTAAAERSSFRRGMDLGADDYLTKPFTHAEVLNMVRARLQQKAVVQAEAQARMAQVRASLEQTLAQSRFTSQVVGMFSHDLRSSLTAILISLDLMRSYLAATPDARVTANLLGIERSVRSLMQTMDDMVMVAEMEAGPLMCVPQTTDVTALVTEVVEEFQVIVGQTHSVLLSEPARVVAEVDPKLLQRLLANLIANAAKYSPTASEISVVLSVEEGGFCLSVADQGIGIPEDELPRLFDPYFRASNATGTKGTGLGLAIVKAVVELHGGTITVESVLNQGTRFSLHFPLAALGRFVFGSSVREQF